MDTKKIYQELKKIEKDLDKERKKFENKCKDKEYRSSQLSATLQRAFIENKMYCPMSKLEEYKGQDIKSITLIEDGQIRPIDCVDILEITEQGKLYVSDFHEGFIVYNPETTSYEETFYGCSRVINIEGFYDLVLSSSPKAVKETTFKHLIQQ